MRRQSGWTRWMTHIIVLKQLNCHIFECATYFSVHQPVRDSQRHTGRRQFSPFYTSITWNQCKKQSTMNATKWKIIWRAHTPECAPPNVLAATHKVNLTFPCGIPSGRRAYIFNVSQLFTHLLTQSYGCIRSPNPNQSDLFKNSVRKKHGSPPCERKKSYRKDERGGERRAQNKNNRFKHT